MKEFNAKIFKEDGKPAKIIYECDKKRNINCKGYGNCRECNYTTDINYAKDISKSNMIISEYTINGTKYMIYYTEESKAEDVFNALNRMIISDKLVDNYKDISITRMFTPVIELKINKKHKSIWEIL